MSRSAVAQNRAHNPRRAHARRRQSRQGVRLDRQSLRAMLTGFVIGATAFVLLAGVTVLSFYLYFQLSGRILLGVRAGDVPLGNRTTEEAASRLIAAWLENRQQLALVEGERRWQVSPEDFGLVLDADATAERAAEVGRGGTILEEMRVTADAALPGYRIAPLGTLDEAIARHALTALAAEVNEPPVDASLRFENGKPVAVPGVPGRALDVEATLAVLAVDPGVILRDGELPLVMAPVSPRIADASAVLTEAERLLSRPLTVSAYDPIADEQVELVATPEMIAGWLDVVAQDDQLAITINEERLVGTVQELSAALGEGRTVDAEGSADELLAALREGRTATLMVEYQPTTYTVIPGDTLTRIAWKTGIPYWRIIQANPDINVDMLTVGQELNLPAKTDLLPLPVVRHKRIVVSISEQHMWAYENGQLIREEVISTGIEDSPTQPGIFQVQMREENAYASAWDLWMPHFVGIYEAWPGFMNGFHGLPSRTGGQLMWANSLGRPASFGCIILTLEAAEWLYHWAEDGVVVEIRA